jgi:hypothetical protein
MTPAELIAVLERGAAHGIHPGHILLALGFRHAGAPADGAGHARAPGR